MEKVDFLAYVAFIIPTIVVAGLSYLFFQKHFKNEDRRRIHKRATKQPSI